MDSVHILMLTCSFIDCQIPPMFTQLCTCLFWVTACCLPRSNLQHTRLLLCAKGPLLLPQASNNGPYGEWDSICRVTGYNGMPSIKIRCG